MAKRTRFTLSDDLTGVESQDVKTVRFSLGDTPYEIDLSEYNREVFLLTIGRYLQAARPAKASNPRSRTDAQRARTRAIRAWAQERGLTIGDKGRIPSRVSDAYWAAHKTETGTEI